MFHSMTKQTLAGLWWIPRWKHWRSQSHMRVNTTACPVADPGSFLTNDPFPKTMKSVSGSKQNLLFMDGSLNGGKGSRQSMNSR